ncbi:hypothetical protein CY34DRAFT_708747 [Suillus luteus UH-Slu-Lm8-n1]|uniref:Unplaced genomic scaffold CY34scaffold_80, whole genome shotgun sequence n=1 Tax=Suillus luteus UH-Slu-Lm8-n1 TaxID=930992 RepID=A0A0D0B0J2_9AGAM|nr:hypothetical protein CY34DRAFT_708747 [Suillus luteus UH-Slu-Lm8-n1]
MPIYPPKLLLLTNTCLVSRFLILCGAGESENKWGSIPYSFFDSPTLVVRISLYVQQRPPSRSLLFYLSCNSYLSFDLGVLVR